MTAAWPRADQGLERAYRRLLLAYPGRYRRRHGTEIVTTLLEMAGPDQRRPGRGEAWHLLLSGVRQRFRLPAGRPLTLLAVALVIVAAGAFGAAAGSWVGEQTFAELPADAELRALGAQAAGVTTPIAVRRDSSPWSARTVTATVDAGTGWSAEQARARFVADGWSVGALTPQPGKAVEGNADGTVTDLPVQYTRFIARKDGLTFTVSGFVTARRGFVDVYGSPTRTAGFLPLVLAGLVLGVLAGWLGAAALSYRLRHSRRRRLATALAAGALLTLVLPVTALYGNLLRVLQDTGDTGTVNTVHSGFGPGPFFDFGSTELVWQLSAAGMLLAAVAVALARPAAQPHEQPAAAAS